MEALFGLVFIGIIIYLVSQYYKNKQSKENNSEPLNDKDKLFNELKKLDSNEAGMYNMNKNKIFSRLERLSTGEEAIVFLILAELNYTFGVCAQGRLDEAKDLVDFNNYKDENNKDGFFIDRLRFFDEQEQVLINEFFFNYYKEEGKNLIKWAIISERIDNNANTRDGETVGQAFDRKALKSNTFMTNYEKYNHDFELIPKIQTDIISKLNK